LSALYIAGRNLVVIFTESGNVNTNHLVAKRKRKPKKETLVLKQEFSQSR